MSIPKGARTASLAFILCLLMLSPAFAQLLDLRIGHLGNPRLISSSADGNRIISTSDEGTLLVWSRQELLARISLGDVSVIFQEMSPDGDRAALLVQNRSGGYSLQGINLQSRSRSFSIEIDDRPLSLAYSPNGSLIILTSAQWESVSLYSAFTGQKQRGLSNGFGIVDFGYMSASNTNFMAYQSTQGTITYRTVQSSQELARIQTVNGLQELYLQSNKRIGLARSGNDVYLIDVVDGRILSQRQYPDLRQIHLVDDKTAALLFLSDNSYSLAWLDLEQLNLSDISSRFRLLNTSGRSRALPGYGIAIDSNQGSISLYPSWSTTGNTIPVKLARSMEHLFRLNGQVLLASSLGLHYFPEDEIFDQLAQSNTVSISRMSSVSLPFQGTPGLATYGEDRVLVWNKSGPGRIWVLSFPDGGQPELLAIGEPRTRAVSRIKDQGDYLILFYQDNSLEVISKLDYSRAAQYSTIGLQDAIVFNNEFLVIAKTREGTLQSSLLRVELRTLETASISDLDQMVYRIAHRPGSQEFYTLGISPVTQGLNTHLRRFTRVSGVQFRTAAPLKTYQGEDLRAALTFVSGRLLTSLGATQIFEWDGLRLLDFSASARTPRDLIGLDDYVGAINLDGSISFWEVGSRKFAAEMHLLSDSSLVLLGQQRNLVVLNPSSPITGTEDLGRLVLGSERLGGLRIQNLDILSQEPGDTLNPALD